MVHPSTHKNTNKALFNEGIRGSGDTASLFLTLNGGELMTLSFSASSTHWIRNWLGPRAGLDAIEGKKISCSFRESNPSSPAHSYSLVTIFDLSWLPQTKRFLMVHSGMSGMPLRKWWYISNTAFIHYTSELVYMLLPPIPHHQFLYSLSSIRRSSVS